MKKRLLRFLGLIGLLAILAAPVIYLWPKDASPSADPHDYLPPHPTHVEHQNIIQGDFQTPQEVTRACLECHPQAASQVRQTSHWTWQSQPFDVPWREAPVTIGKFNQINNFCISTAGNESKCMTCHIGYAWEQYPPRQYDFSLEENVDCLVCHAAANTYAKGAYGNPAEGVDLLAAAKSVGIPTRDTCGSCHFNGGGGNGVKHGDLDESLYHPDEQLDVHMGKYDFLCTDCHRTSEHHIKGRLVADNYRIDPSEQVQCVDCHISVPHDDDRINAHLESLACQTCHIPTTARKNPTKTFWDWSQAGEDRDDDHYTYLKIKGEFTYERNVQPTYIWFNGSNAYRYLLGDKIADPSQPVYINKPAGDIDDPAARIFPFKIMDTIQPYDAEYMHLLAPITAGEGGYWHDFDWDQAFRLADERLGIAYSGHYAWVETLMYWPQTHMVEPAGDALQCNDCHGEGGRMDWQALGYPGDPADWGGRFSNQ